MLKLENLCYRYKKSERDALSNISAEFKASYFTSIIGPSGSGKTTLLSIMAGLDKPTSGKILIDGQDMQSMNLDRYRREKVAIIFQAFQLFPLLTALENVRYPTNMQKYFAGKLLKSVGIDEEKFNRYPAKLSGGEQQRVAIARALSTGAKLILADEPTGNLDTANGKLVVDILKQLAHEKGCAVIIVTHNLEIAETSDLVYSMKDGELVLQ